MIPIFLLLLIAPMIDYGMVPSCWCLKGPDTYQELVDSYQFSQYTNCYLSGNNPSSDTCYDAICPGGDWVKGHSYLQDGQTISATDGDDCISKCSALGGGFNIANMQATCSSAYYYYYNDDDDSFGSCNVYTCPNIWDGHCGAFNKPTDKWCDYDGPGSTANICCADDYSECCEADGGAIGGTIAGAVVFIIFYMNSGPYPWPPMDKPVPSYDY